MLNLEKDLEEILDLNLSKEQYGNQTNINLSNLYDRK